MEAASERSDFNKMVKKGSAFDSLVQRSNPPIFSSHILQTKTMQMNTNNNQKVPILYVFCLWCPKIVTSTSSGLYT